MDKVTARLKQLKDKIANANYQYYVKDMPNISDAHYDKLMRELEDIEKKYPQLVTDDSPTQRVGNKVADEFETFIHKAPMLSLANAFGTGEILNFDKRCHKFLDLDEYKPIEYICELKLDGLAVSLQYKNGMLVSASTRGDGTKGENITENIRTIKSVPLNINTFASNIPDEINIRGEVIITYKDFERLNQQREQSGEATFANPRNAAAGSVRQLDPKITAKRSLTMYCYSAAEREFFDSQQNLLKKLDEWGFLVNSNCKLCKNINEVIDYIEKWRDERKMLNYDTDGMVIKINDITFQKKAGELSRSPRWAIAFKYPPKIAQTTIKNIRIQVGRTGVLTPVAEMEPVAIDGVVISRATLHNQDEINRKDIRIGDTVVLQRAGDVIPEIIEVIKDKRPKTSEPFTIPPICPVCASAAMRTNNEAVLRCTGANCPAKLKERIKHFASRDAADIEGLGTSLAEQLVDRGFVKSPQDIYHLTMTQLLTLDKMGEKSAQNLLDAIEKSKNITLSRLIFALGIQHIGKRTAEVLAEKYETLDKLSQATCEELLEIDDIGEVMAKSICDYFADEKSCETIASLKQSGVNMEQKATMPKRTIFEGKIVLFTGSLSIMTRAQAQNKVKELGGTISESISKKVNLVVAGENAGSKLEKAKSLDVEIISEDIFLKLIETDKKQPNIEALMQETLF